MKHEHITGLILAGGLGSRMGGQDKGLVELAGQPMVKHVLDRLAPQVHQLMINANRNAAAYAAFSPWVVPDRLAGFVGPLAGLDAALHDPALEGDWVLTCPCDSPFLPLDLAPRLLTAARAANAQVAMVSVGGQPEPAFLLAHRGVAPSLAAFLEGGGRQIRRWVGETQHVVVDFSDCPGAFSNINTPEELARQAPRP
ncbi:molybdenum cofactor guanylyltransferase MobA [Zoogloea sp.]|uniref:molybdenum cofactor guanylyltransferase MobA n=1 Tax=Zoogloea sp. TaxID=49181 RepID=UPI001DF3A507|nr:molybdenum cofactor guanylyltransferase MobA [Zoogloea sp.]MBK6655557.1 molybdenum cofactor guanylyltransferase [Zoogloea sp.]